MRPTDGARSPSVDGRPGISNKDVQALRLSDGRVAILTAKSYPRRIPIPAVYTLARTGRPIDDN